MINGLSAAQGITVTGQGALGIQAEVDLAVGDGSNLAIGDGNDLAITLGVQWAGLSASFSVSSSGISASVAE